MSEKFFNHEANNNISFTVDYDWEPYPEEYHHEPRLAKESYELVRQAVIVPPDICKTIDSTSSERCLKTYALGPCIFFCVNNSKKEQLGGIHLDENSNITRLIEDLYQKFGIENLDGFKTKLIGGIKEMPSSERLKKKLALFFSENDITIDDDRSMRLLESSYEGRYTEESVPLLFYQAIIIDKKTGEILSFDPFSDESK